MMACARSSSWRTRPQASSDLFVVKIIERCRRCRSVRTRSVWSAPGVATSRRSWRTASGQRVVSWVSRWTRRSQLARANLAAARWVDVRHGDGAPSWTSFWMQFPSTRARRIRCHRSVKTSLSGSDGSRRGFPQFGSDPVLRFPRRGRVVVPRCRCPMALLANPPVQRFERGVVHGARVVGHFCRMLQFVSEECNRSVVREPRDKANAKVTDSAGIRDEPQRTANPPGVRPRRPEVNVNDDVGSLETIDETPERLRPGIAGRKEIRE